MLAIIGLDALKDINNGLNICRWSYKYQASFKFLVEKVNYKQQLPIPIPKWSKVKFLIFVNLS